jgi:hypothetical protein
LPTSVNKFDKYNRSISAMKSHFTKDRKDRDRISDLMTTLEGLSESDPKSLDLIYGNSLI